MSVDWTDRARDELADIYVQATPAERDLIESIILALERDLAVSPLNVSESRHGELRFDSRSPLAFWFSVTPTGDKVRVVRVRRPKRK